MEIEPIREILRRTDMLLEITGKQPGYTYAAERIGGSASGNSHVTRAKALGYELVRGDDPENAGLRDANGFCVIGDVAIMRIKTERLEEINKELQSIIKTKRGDVEGDNQVAKQLSEELSRRLGKPTNVVFSFNDPKDLANRRQ